MMETLMTDLNTGILKANLLESTKKIARVSGILMEQLVDKGDEQRLKEIEDVITRALQWRSTQSKEMNSVQLKRAMSIWEESTQYLLTNKDKLKNIAVNEVIFTIKTSAVAVYDTLQNMDQDIFRYPKVNNESVDPSWTKPKRKFCLGIHVWGVCVGAYVS
ncbi:uncharacterized protein LOC131954323 isoform X1 [Physella acuta]|uniref:uncharacterized protein LOC131954323 isoform X1 n=1 Tax=Physella acuta TaxID=109671 RepID=UPI0027DC7406|nr:uncharacterized protein LOC131954323 isoform X1 [Physella acuta]